MNIYEYLAQRVNAAFDTYATKKKLAAGSEDKILAAAKEKDELIAKIEQVVKLCQQLQLDL